MEIEFDPNKNQRNIEKRQISFEMAEQFEWKSSLIWKDNRHNYGETRFCALGYIGVRIYHLAFTLRSDRVRVISLRKANRREVNKYAET
ncbi:MAG: BrnT family toxin [Tenericutes bacterium]|nr:MAG: BrnT family toxin [Mycoplasmatota bacterium]